VSLNAVFRRMQGKARVYAWRKARGPLRNIAPRYVRRHEAQAGFLVTMGRLVIGPTPTTRRGRKARARIGRAASRRGVG
jgi:hypothetical protein